MTASKLPRLTKAQRALVDSMQFSGRPIIYDAIIGQYIYGLSTVDRRCVKSLIAKGAIIGGGDGLIKNIHQTYWAAPKPASQP